MSAVGRGLALAGLLLVTPPLFAARRDTSRDFPTRLTCPVHYGWPEGAPGTAPRVRPELAFRAVRNEALITFMACDNRNVVDAALLQLNAKQVDLTLDDVMVVRKPVFDAGQVAWTDNGCYVNTPVQSVFDRTGHLPFTPDLPFLDTFDGTPQGWALGNAEITLYSPDGFLGNLHPTGQRLVLGESARGVVETVENGNADWFTDSNQGVNVWAIVSTASHSPTQSWFVSDPDTVSDQRLQTVVSSSVCGPANGNSCLIPSGYVMSFWHRYNTEASPPNYFDGGVLEYSVDSGFSWSDILAGSGGVPANPNRFLSGGYNGTISTGYQSPILGRPAWSGDNAVFQEVRVDLSDFTGQTAIFRWRFASDISVASVGWWVDDVTLLRDGDDCSTARIRVKQLVPGEDYVIDFRWDAAEFAQDQGILTTIVEP